MDEQLQAQGKGIQAKHALQQCLHVQVPNEMATQYQDVVSAQDIAVYGGLCALASFDRSDLRSYVINNVSFRDYMEVNPEVMLTALCAKSLLQWAGCVTICAQVGPGAGKERNGGGGGGGKGLGGYSNHVLASIRFRVKGLPSTSKIS